jgi:hypothetical protein
MTYFKKSIKENFDTMKKNVMLKIASVLMIAVLLTTCAISSTFAKYTTTGATFKDEAVVAKWGVQINAKTEGLFADTYALDNAAGSVTNAVKAKVDVVAPGTTASANALYTVTGTPEVAIEVIRDFDIKLDGWYIDGTTEYCPLIITVNKVDYYVGKEADTQTGAAAIDSVDALISAVKFAVLGADVTTKTEYFEPNKDLGEIACLADISWRWDFDKDTQLTVKNQSDENDTKLGNWALDVSATAPSVEISFSMTVNQIN